MKFKKTGSLVSLSFLAVSLCIVFSSCSCKITDEQLAKIADLRRQERTLNSEITAQQNAKAKLDGELKSRTAEVNDCNSRKEIVKQRLSVWPNIWPDYTPEP
jgi:septal ring factor EnvC (AmiA/AmiB activator)